MDKQKVHGVCTGDCDSGARGQLLRRPAHSPFKLGFGALAGVLLLAAAMSAQTPQPPEPNQDTPIAAPTAATASQVPAPAAPEPAPVSESRVGASSDQRPSYVATAERSDLKPSMSRFEVLTLWLTLAGVVAAIVVLLVQLRQLAAMQSANTAALIAARAAEQSAKAAFDAVAIQKLANQQWLEGTWVAVRSDGEQGREVQVALRLQNPTAMSIAIKQAEYSVAGPVGTAPGFRVINTLELVGFPFEVGPKGDVQAALIYLPWLEEPHNGTQIVARISFLDTFGNASQTTFATVIAWRDQNRVTVSPGPTRTVRIAP